MHTKEEPFVIDDIAYKNKNDRNADPCTSDSCVWSKSSDGMVYVPYVIAEHYCKQLNSSSRFFKMLLIQLTFNKNTKLSLAIEKFQGMSGTREHHEDLRPKRLIVLFHQL